MNTPTVTSTVANPQGTLNFAMGAIAIAFLIYITAKGELPTYLSFFSISISSAGSNTSSTLTSGATPGQPGLSSNPLAGLPTSWADFFHFPSFGNAATKAIGGAASTGYGGN